ncbi:MAG: DUF4180 domain-containing protein [Anaerolineae bacterium]
MDLRVTEYNGHPFAEAADPQPLEMGDINDVLGFCFQYGDSRLLLHADNLPPGFFDLSTGVAGALLQKFRQYQIRLAVVWSPQAVKPTARFGEMAAEENKGNHFRLAEDREGAAAWLVSGAG